MTEAQLQKLAETDRSMLFGKFIYDGPTSFRKVCGSVNNHSGGRGKGRAKRSLSAIDYVSASADVRARIGQRLLMTLTRTRMCVGYHEAMSCLG